MGDALRLTGLTGGMPHGIVLDVRLVSVRGRPTVHKGASTAMIARCPHPTIRRPYGARAHVPAGAARPPVGELLAGRYRVAELAGHGATGGVWRAEDELLDRDVAVKRLPHRQPQGMAEARIAARVRHPSVAAVHDLIEHDESSWMVMDYYPGGTLATLLRDRHRLPPPVIAALGLQLVTALDAVHAAGIVHCDVKPTNLLLGADGRLVLVDFGIAEAGDAGPVNPARDQGFVVGSPAYMAPELVRGETAGPAADVWSLGATLYAAVEGRPPFGGDAADILVAVLNDPPPPPRRAGPLAPLLDRLLVKDPAGRPSHDAIRAALADVSPRAPATLSPTRGAGDLATVGSARPVTDRAGADAEPTLQMSPPRGS
jgi:eukaryotic-like serine/threonine-protein kinase